MPFLETGGLILKLAPVMYFCCKENSKIGGFPSGSVGKNPPVNAGDTGSSPGPGRSHTLWSN